MVMHPTMQSPKKEKKPTLWQINSFESTTDKKYNLITNYFSYFVLDRSLYMYNMHRPLPLSTKWKQHTAIPCKHLPIWLKKLGAWAENESFMWRPAMGDNLLLEYRLITLIPTLATHALRLPESSSQILELQPRANSRNSEEAAPALALLPPWCPAKALNQHSWE